MVIQSDGIDDLIWGNEMMNRLIKPTDSFDSEPAVLLHDALIKDVLCFEDRVRFVLGNRVQLLRIREDGVCDYSNINKGTVDLLNCIPKDIYVLYLKRRVSSKGAKLNGNLMTMDDFACRFHRDGISMCVIEYLHTKETFLWVLLARSKRQLDDLIVIYKPGGPKILYQWENAGKLLRDTLPMAFHPAKVKDSVISNIQFDDKTVRFMFSNGFRLVQNDQEMSAVKKKAVMTVGCDPKELDYTLLLLKNRRKGVALKGRDIEWKDLDRMINDKGRVIQISEECYGIGPFVLCGSIKRPRILRKTQSIVVIHKYDSPNILYEWEE